MESGRNAHATLCASYTGFAFPCGIVGNPSPPLSGCPRSAVAGRRRGAGERPLPLALRAVEGRAVRLDDPLDRPAAAQARLALPIVYAQPVGELAGVAGGVAVVEQGGASKLDGFVEHL